MDFVIIILLVVIAVLVTVCLLQLKNNTTPDITVDFSPIERKLSDEFYRSRTEEANTKDTINKQLLEMQKQNYESQLALSDRISISLKNIQDGNEKKLDEMRKTVDEKLTSTLTTRLDSSFKTVSEQLENLYKSLGEMKELSAGVTTNVTSLNRILTNVKARGTWAEVQLEQILDQTIPGMYDKNVATVLNSQKRVEFAVKVPSGEDPKKFAYLPIDSKLPLEDYARLCAAADAADPIALESARKALEQRIKDEARDIKQYINEPVTTPFAIMYLATEGLYAEVTSSKNGLVEKLQSEFNVMVAGPTTITALLSSLSMGFRAIAINEKAEEVRKLLSVTKAQYETFGADLAKAKKKLHEAGSALDEVEHRSNIINKKLRTIDAMELGAANEYLQIED